MPINRIYKTFVTVGDKTEITVACIPADKELDLINLCCFRGKPANHSSESSDQWNLKLQQSLLQENQIFLSLPAHKGSRCLRTALLNPFTTVETIDHIFKQMDDFYSHGRD